MKNINDKIINDIIQQANLDDMKTIFSEMISQSNRRISNRIAIILKDKYEILRKDNIDFYKLKKLITNHNYKIGIKTDDNIVIEKINYIDNIRGHLCITVKYPYTSINMLISFIDENGSSVDIFNYDEEEYYPN